MDITQDTTILGFPPRLFAYIVAVVAAATGALAVSAAQITARPPDGRTWLAIALFLALSLTADLHPVPLDENGNAVSLAFVFLISARLIFGWQYAIPMAAISVIVPEL